MNDDVRGPRAGTPEAVSTDVAFVRLRLDIAYDGTDFAGWASQPGQRTVAGEVWRSLSDLFGEVRGLTVAGRTDAGVHAAGQVAHVDVPEDRWRRYQDRPLWRLRGMLPPDVRITGVTEVPGSFDARFSALARRYVYRVADTVWGVNPLRRRDTAAWPRDVDVAAMNAAAAVLVGEHDFAAFCKRREGATTVRALRAVSWERDAAGIAEMTVVADAFCHSMVRSLVGAMLAVGEGRRDAAWLSGLLELRQRSGQVLVAPACGLTLAAIEYPAAADWAARQSETRRRRVLDEESRADRVAPG